MNNYKISFKLRGKAVYMVITWNGLRHRESTGEKAHRGLKEDVIIGDDNATARLTKLKRKVQILFNRLEATDERFPTLDEVKSLFKPSEEIKEDFFSVYDIFLKEMESKPTKTGLTRPQTIRHYESFKNKLIEFRDKYGAFDFKDIDLKFYGKYRHYRIKECNITPVTFGEKDVKLLKAFLEWAFWRDYPVNQIYRKFEKPRAESNPIPLKEEEILKLWDMDLGKDQYKLDIFLNMLSTCFRISDQYLYNPSWIQPIINYEGGIKRERKIITYRAYKTNRVCYCPFEDDLFFRPVYLYNKYEGKFPKISGQKLNKFLTDFSKEHELSVTLTSKVARHSGATQRRRIGMNLEHIMKITGHATEKSLRYYLGLHVEDMLKEHDQKAQYLKVG